MLSRKSNRYSRQYQIIQVLRDSLQLILTTQLMPKKLTKDFFLETDVLKLSRDLLGKLLVTNFDGQRTAGVVVETEAYRAPDDWACHATKFPTTLRSKPMFTEGGRAYVYICRGVHHLFNITTAPEGMAHVILVRAIEPSEGVATMLERRGLEKLKPNLTAGPSSLAKALGINVLHNEMSLISGTTNIWFEENDVVFQDSDIDISKRIGVESAGVSADLEWRFFVKNNVYVSQKNYFKDKK